MWTLKKCCCNCHTLFGKVCGCCSRAAGIMTFDCIGENGSNAPELHKVYNGFINECISMAD